MTKNKTSRPQLVFKIAAHLSFAYHFGENGKRYSIVSSDDSDFQEWSEQHDREVNPDVACAVWPCGHEELFGLGQAGAIANALTQVLAVRKGTKTDDEEADDHTVIVNSGSDYTFSFSPETDWDAEADSYVTTGNFLVSGEDSDIITPAVARRLIAAMRDIEANYVSQAVLSKAAAGAQKQLSALKGTMITKKATKPSKKATKKSSKKAQR